MPEFALQESAHIEAPRQQVYNIVRDFRGWPAWSPWLICEPGCKLTFDDDGNAYSWEGDIVGSGRMQIVADGAPDSINYQLNFFTPWKSESAVQFQFADAGGGTEVTWAMRGSLPLFMFWMKRMMIAFLGSDFRRGLAMLKDRVETGDVPCDLTFPGVAQFEGFSYLGVKTRCAMEEIGPAMETAIGQLATSLSESGIATTGRAFSIYHKWALVRGYTDFTVGFPIASVPADVPGELVAGQIPDCPTYRVEHKGPYRHLGNAWAAAMMHGRAKKFKANRCVHPFEIYLNRPGEVADEELVTLIHMPVS